MFEEIQLQYLPPNKFTAVTSGAVFLDAVEAYWPLRPFPTDCHGPSMRALYIPNLKYGLLFQKFLGILWSWISII